MRVRALLDSGFLDSDSGVDSIAVTVFANGIEVASGTSTADELFLSWESAALNLILDGTVFTAIAVARNRAGWLGEAASAAPVSLVLRALSLSDPWVSDEFGAPLRTPVIVNPWSFSIGFKRTVDPMNPAGDIT